MPDFRYPSISSSTQRTGVALAVITALISGFAVFINGHGLRAWKGTADPTTYTTFKNIVAGVLLVSIAVIATRRGSNASLTKPKSATQWTLLGLIAVFGGAVAFALFFEGFARASSTQAAFIHKTLIVWVGILAVGLLHEKVRPIHFVALALLVVGQFLIVGGVSDVSMGQGELMMLAATLIWSMEVIVAKKLLTELSPLTIGVARMAGGAAVLVAYGFVGGGFAAMGQVTAAQVAWILAVGVVLSGFVGCWFASLSRAPAIDVTAILVGGAVLTALLKTGIDGVPAPSLAGLVMVAAGAAVVAVAAYSGRRGQGGLSNVDR